MPQWYYVMLDYQGMFACHIVVTESPLPKDDFMRRFHNPVEAHMKAAGYDTSSIEWGKLPDNWQSLEYIQMGTPGVYMKVSEIKIV